MDGKIPSTDSKVRIGATTVAAGNPNRRDVAMTVERNLMTDLALVLIVLAFFALCVLYIRGCERIIRNDEIEDTTVELTHHASDRP